LRHLTIALWNTAFVAVITLILYYAVIDRPDAQNLIIGIGILVAVTSILLTTQVPRLLLLSAVDHRHLTEGAEALALGRQQLQARNTSRNWTAGTVPSGTGVPLGNLAPGARGSGGNNTKNKTPPQGAGMPVGMSTEAMLAEIKALQQQLDDGHILLARAKNQPDSVILSQLGQGGTGGHHHPNQLYGNGGLSLLAGGGARGPVSHAWGPPDENNLTVANAPTLGSTSMGSNASPPVHNHHLLLNGASSGATGSLASPLGGGNYNANNSSPINYTPSPNNTPNNIGLTSLNHGLLAAASSTTNNNNNNNNISSPTAAMMIVETDDGGVPTRTTTLEAHLSSSKSMKSPTSPGLTSATIGLLSGPRLHISAAGSSSTPLGSSSTPNAAALASSTSTGGSSGAVSAGGYSSGGMDSPIRSPKHATITAGSMPIVTLPGQTGSKPNSQVDTNNDNNNNMSGINIPTNDGSTSGSGTHNSPMMLPGHHSHPSLAGAGDLVDMVGHNNGAGRMGAPLGGHAPMNSGTEGSVGSSGSTSTMAAPTRSSPTTTNNTRSGHPSQTIGGSSGNNGGLAVTVTNDSSTAVASTTPTGAGAPTPTTVPRTPFVSMQSDVSLL
jgi:hypothetical protein